MPTKGTKRTSQTRIVRPTRRVVKSKRQEDTLRGEPLILTPVKPITKDYPSPPIKKVKPKNNRFNYTPSKSYAITPDKFARFPASWEDNISAADKRKGVKSKKFKDNTKRRKQYIAKGMIPVLIPIGKSKTTDEILKFGELTQKKVDILHEKSYPSLPKSGSKLSTAGQNMQNSYHDQPNANMLYRGIFDQKGNRKNPLPHTAIATEIWVDPDDTGHYTAFINNMLTRRHTKGKMKGKADPFYENVRVVTKDGVSKPQAPTLHKVMRFYVGNLIDSAGFRRNALISNPVLKDRTSKVALTYRDPKGTPVTFSTTEQKLAICHAIYTPRKTVQVRTPDKTVEFEFITKDIPVEFGDDVELIFDRNDAQPITRLTSDDMVLIMVDKMGIEPDQAQTTLEALYHQKWINYPRSDTAKAEEEHVYPIKDISLFKGTPIETQTLRIIADANDAYEEEPKRNYKDNGTWLLINKNTILMQTKGYRLPNEDELYTDAQFDISILQKGISPTKLTEYIADNEIGTPATRHSQFSELKQSGIVKRVGETYALDKRGLIFVATYNYYRDYTWNVIDLKQQLKKLGKNHVPKMIDLLSWIQPINQEEQRKAKIIIGKMADDLIAGEQDLSTLDTF